MFRIQWSEHYHSIPIFITLFEWYIQTMRGRYIHITNWWVTEKKMKCITKSILPMYEQLVWFSLKVQSWLLFYNAMNRVDSEKRPVLLIILKINWSSTLFIPHLHWMIFISHTVLICRPIYFIKKVSISNFRPSSFYSWL